MTYTALQLVVRAVSLAALIVLYYLWIVDKIGRWVRVPLFTDRLKRQYPTRHVEAAFQLWNAGVLQAGFFGVVYLLYQPANFGLQFDPVTILLGIVLGIGEMGLGNLFGLMAIVSIDTLQRRSAPDQGHSVRASSQHGTGWYTIARGGWMQYYIKAMTVLPLPVAVAFVVLYVFFEESIFRGIVLGTLASLGAGFALVASIALFALVQTFHTPGWRTALFPVIGAVVVGAVHGVLYLTLPNIVPLVVAHAAYFFAAMWSMRKLEAVPRMSTFG